MNYIRPTNDVIDTITILPEVDIASELSKGLRARPSLAVPHRIRKVWTGLVDRVRASSSRRQTRRMLMELDDRQLRDIGIKRDDI
ncbi:DUF1127 domain-containing protein [Ochrobactrum sp. RH2CCR150]|uniref:DUF1127 domain-containing protein n=1 Tax=Ochrobactrum sp. RH2CCR150 TaxID=2587044 RepID=UPI0015F9D7D8|nr:uncharacterized protein YjiS (DUF1127 family) [Ochrobactrum sp. RH2CCR150]